MSEAGPTQSPIQTQNGVRTPALEFVRVCFTYPGEDRADAVLRDVSLRVEPGERLGILGPNGGGKSTLLRLALGLLVPTSGSVRVFGRTPTEARRAGLVGYLEQRSGAGLDWPVTVREVVQMPIAARLSPWKSLSGDESAHVDRVLGLVGLAALGSRRIGALSGGQRQRALIARALACRPSLLVLDEPTVGVDVEGQRRFAEMLDALRAELDLTIVVVSHDLAAVAATSDRVGCLRRTLHYHSAPDGLTPAVLAEVFSHDVEAAFGAVHVAAHAASACEGHDHGCAHPGCDGGDDEAGAGR